MGVSEANIKESYKQNCNFFPEYNIELNKMSSKYDISRNCTFINNKISYKRRLDLEDNLTCTIWIEVFIPKSKSLLIMCGYRQWQLLKMLNNPKSCNPKEQLGRFKNIIDNWEKALSENRDTIVMMDNNIDSNPNSSHYKTYKLKDLYNTLQGHLNKHHLTLHNTKLTRFASHQPPSCIDHIYSNCANKITNVITHSNPSSDHSIITAEYNSVHQIYHPKFIKVRNYKSLNRFNLEKYINNSSILNSIFRYTDPELITNIIQIELNAIINLIAPPKIVQFRKNYTPYYTEEIRNNIKESETLLNIAIKNYNQDDWRNFKNFRNKLCKDVAQEKTKYIETKFQNKGTQWKFLKQFNKNEKQQVPNNITFNNKHVTSPKEIAKIANNFFIDKIIQIRNGFTTSEVNPIDILSSLIPRCTNEFELPFITIEETKQLIKKFKNPYSVGHDDINNKIIKKVGDVLAPHITHMINSIIKSSTIPTIFKVSRILPISKPQKSLNNIESYRPLNNLVCLEKLLEQHILNNLNNFLEENNILHENHHGGRKSHSTLTAVTQIYNELFFNYENDKISVTLCTDLSAAYDTIDTTIVLDKLEHYGIRGQNLLLFKSYFTDRKQFVQIDHFKSQVKNSLNCGCVQGGKLSGTLYNIYCNEIPIIHKLMNSQLFEK